MSLHQIAAPTRRFVGRSQRSLFKGRRGSILDWRTILGGTTMFTRKRWVMAEDGKLDLLWNDLRRPGVYLAIILLLSVVLKLVIMICQPGTLGRIGSNLYRLWRLTQDGPI